MQEIFLAQWYDNGVAVRHKLPVTERTVTGIIACNRQIIQVRLRMTEIPSKRSEIFL
jgi:hypothetical protein